LWNYVSVNVCDLVKPPRIVSREGVPLTLEQAHTLLECAREHRLELLLTMAVVTGMRRGELLALRWSNIDVEHQTLLVLHTVDYIPKYGYVETEPKTAAGKRLISLPSFLLEMLEQHRVKQGEQQLKLADSWENRDLVFPDLHGGYFNPNYLLRVFKKLLKKAGVPHMPFHDLRHSAATILLSMGVNMKVVQGLLGHSDIAITLGRYSHLLPSMQKDIIDKWEGAFGHDGKGTLIPFSIREAADEP
ncbi:MAG: site-specific integrase, partial [Chloroflexota bacterium]|nr:site-specific integrase [Chloroflexota bacterium]